MWKLTSTVAFLLAFEICCCLAENGLRAMKDNKVAIDHKEHASGMINQLPRELMQVEPLLPDESIQFNQNQRANAVIRRPTKRPTRRPVKRPTKRPTRKPTDAPTSNIAFRTPSPTKIKSPTPTASPTTQISHIDDWLTGHNDCRFSFFSRHGLGPKNLRWDASLADRARIDAEQLLTQSDCQGGGLDGRYGGWNSYVSYGYNRPELTFRSPKGVVNSWCIQQVLPTQFQRNFLQVAWRNTTRVGCAQGSKVYDAGNLGTGYCFIQVCRYMAPGGCGNANDALNDNKSC